MKKLTLLSLVAVISCLCFSVSAKTWRVSNVDLTANFSTLDAAMAGISAGDTIYLEGSPEAYSFSAAINKKVTIVGPGYFLNQNTNTQVNKVAATISGNVNAFADSITFEGIYFYSDLNSHRMNIGADNITIRRCGIDEIEFYDNNSATKKKIYNTTITQCYIYADGISGYYEEAYNTVITNNIFSYNYGEITYLKNAVIENNTFASSFGIKSNTGCSIKNNIISSVAATNTNCTISNNYAAGTNDYVSQNGASTDGSWQLQEMSGGMTAGTNGSQCGAFGGSSPYILSGLANVPHIYEIDAPASASAASGLKVTVKIGIEK